MSRDAVATSAAIRVLVVDDSRVAREYLTHILEADRRIRVLDAVGSGEAAVAFVSATRPDIVLMDLHLPGIDGFEATRRIMAEAPVPIIVCTAGTSFDEVKTAMEALKAGALTALRKPVGPMHPNADADAATLVSMLRVLSRVPVVRRWSPSASATPATTATPATGLSAATALVNGAAAQAAMLSGTPAGGPSLVAIGASTGGPPALARLLLSLPDGFNVPVVIVQHITQGFTEGFCTWLGTETHRTVRIPRHGEQLEPGVVYVAGDGAHLRVAPGGRLETSTAGPQTTHRPSIGILFTSAAEVLGRRAVGVLLTGMGRDGAAELKTLADAGAMTIAQDEASSVVFGMPGEAIALGAAQAILPPAEIGSLLGRMAGHHQARA